MDLTVLATNVHSAIDVFLKAVDAFNQRDEKKLEALLDTNVVLVTVAQHTPYRTKQEVLDYLKKHEWPVKPSFEPTTIQVTENHSGNVAHIIGTAKWNDKDGDKDGPIRYAFNLIYKNGGWLISTLWGSSDA